MNTMTLQLGMIEDAILEASMQMAITTGEPPRYTELVTTVPVLTPDNIFSDEWRTFRSIRSWFINRYSFAVPTLEAIQAIASYGNVLEVGAGSGLWSRIISHHVEVIATDIEISKNSYGQQVGVWFNSSEATAVDAVKMNPGRTVLMVWPSHDESWAYETIKAMKRGSILCYVGEGHGGCTGDDTFHNYLDKRFDNLEDIQIPQFEGIHDQLYILRKT